MKKQFQKMPRQKSRFFILNYGTGSARLGGQLFNTHSSNTEYLKRQFSIFDKY